MFPSAYLHMGGDEVNSECWNFKPSIKEFMNANNISNYTQL